jgi:hypothetical protein
MQELGASRAHERLYFAIMCVFVKWVFPKEGFSSQSVRNGKQVSYEDIYMYYGGLQIIMHFFYKYKFKVIQLKGSIGS